MIDTKYYCDHCGKLICPDQNRITFRWDGKFFANSTSFVFCETCKKELEKFVHCELRK